MVEGCRLGSALGLKEGISDGTTVVGGIERHFTSIGIIELNIIEDGASDEHSLVSVNVVSAGPAASATPAEGFTTIRCRVREEVPTPEVEEQPNQSPHGPTTKSVHSSSEQAMLSTGPTHSVPPYSATCVTERLLDDVPSACEYRSELRCRQRGLNTNRYLCICLSTIATRPRRLLHSPRDRVQSYMEAIPVWRGSSRPHRQA